jgi:glutathione S-transferase
MAAGARRRYALVMKLYRLRYSPFARKVQMLLDLLRAKYDLIEVPYTDRDELVRATGGYAFVPVLVDDRGQAHFDSRVICEHLLAGDAGARLVPPPWEGPVWAYADFSDSALEDPMFKIASPAVRDAWKAPWERALYVLVKERKYGPGCVEQWERERDALVGQARRLLAPTLRTLAARPFLFGDAPTLADAALYGHCIMLEEADPRLLGRVAEELVPYVRRVEASALR